MKWVRRTKKGNEWSKVWHAFHRADQLHFRSKKTYKTKFPWQSKVNHLVYRLNIKNIWYFEGGKGIKLLHDFLTEWHAVLSCISLQPNALDVNLFLSNCHSPCVLVQTHCSFGKLLQYLTVTWKKRVIKTTPSGSRFRLHPGALCWGKHQTWHIYDLSQLSLKAINHACLF